MMTRNTTAMNEARAAKKAKEAAEQAEWEAALPALLERRTQQLEVIGKIIVEWRARQSKFTQSKQQHALLTSVLEGLYVEIDKQCKKAAGELITDLGLDQVNDIIKAIKDLANDDPYVQKQKEFVPAGDNPQLRDVIIVLKQLSQGLAREKSFWVNREAILAGRLEEARTIESGLKCFIKFCDPYLSQEDIARQGFSAASNLWFEGNLLANQRLFNWAKLDQTDLNIYFA
jgi:hypothetical protein